MSNNKENKKPVLSNGNSEHFEKLVKKGDWITMVFESPKELRNFRANASYHKLKLSIRKTFGVENQYLVELKENAGES